MGTTSEVYGKAERKGVGEMNTEEKIKELEHRVAFLEEAVNKMAKNMNKLLDVIIDITGSKVKWRALDE